MSRRSMRCCAAWTAGYCPRTRRATSWSSRAPRSGSASSSPRSPQSAKSSRSCAAASSVFPARTRDCMSSNEKRRKFCIMTEIEVKPEHAADPDTRRVGILVGVVGILLSLVTIASHRSHTQAVIHRTESNDAWAYYQAKKIREYTSEVAVTLLHTLGADPARSEAAIQKLEAARGKYAADAETIQQDAKAKDQKSEAEEVRALRFDIGEGLLELG